MFALAVLTVSAASFAQSTVTLYGVADQGYNTDKKTVGTVATKTTGLASILSGSRFGFKGTEDLGGGLKANFVMEYAVATDDATTSMANRQSFVGLAGAFGSVNLGRQYSQIHAVQGTFDANGNATAAGWLGGGTSTVRTSNAVVYTTPSFGGFSAALELGAGEVAQGGSGAVTGNANNLTALGLSYANGPLTVKAATESIKLAKLAYAAPGIAAAVDLSNALADRKANSIGASYDLGVAKLMAVTTSAKAGTAADAGEVKTNNFGVSIPVGAVALNATVSNGSYVDSGAASVKTSGYQVGANYSLSKRTTAYALMGQGKNKAATATKHDTFAVGVRHTF
ncbi:MAG: porin [Pseudomonadota bacterium]